MQLSYQRDMDSAGRDINVGISFGRGNFELVKKALIAEMQSIYLSIMDKNLTSKEMDFERNL